MFLQLLETFIVNAWTQSSDVTIADVWQVIWDAMETEIATTELMKRAALPVRILWMLAYKTNDVN